MVEYIRRKKVRNLRIEVGTNCKVRVILPYRLSMDEAKRIAQSKQSWINKQVLRMKKLGALHQMGAILGPKLSKEKAQMMLIQRTWDLANLHGFTYSHVSIRNQKTKWGSCSSANRISLNQNLTRLPDELRDYVIVHELVHTRIKSHQPDFWRAMDALLGDARHLRRELNQYRLAFFN